MRGWLLKRWYTSVPAPRFLWPLSVLFGFVAAVRRRAQQQRALASRLSVPVIVVGNIAVGGTGKTPFVIWLVERLRAWGWKPGVISRGYGGKSNAWPQVVGADSDTGWVGDEPVLIAQRAACPVVVGPDRLVAARALLAGGGVDIIVSDDGLQHYRLHRDLEIAVVDASRGLGNGELLPAGPLREPPARLGEVALVVANGTGWTAPTGRQLNMRLYSLDARSLTGEGARPIASFAGQTVHAVAGIGNPARFFSMLSQHGIRLVMHPFPDHHVFTAADFAFGDDLPVLMTEKDAVKCRAIARAHHWVVPVEAGIAEDDVALVQELTQKLRTRS
ncbi:MAG TPA: tetraacyldisaccharide 4'-kinase [Verrucomicrobiae bacterium]|nr:tetraacyldisaccharide 4'-kinase [Verrucomicrobiae bacterium]